MDNKSERPNHNRGVVLDGNVRREQYALSRVTVEAFPKWYPLRLNPSIHRNPGLHGSQFQHFFHLLCWHRSWPLISKSFFVLIFLRHLVMTWTPVSHSNKVSHFLVFQLLNESSCLLFSPSTNLCCDTCLVSCLMVSHDLPGQIKHRCINWWR